MKAFFGPKAVFTPSSFKFNYTADCGQSLVARQWQNADKDNGGNTGDIASAGEDVTPNVFPCPTPMPSPSTSSTATPTSVPTTVTLAQTGSGIPGWPVAVLFGFVLLSVGAFMIRRRI